MRASRLLSIQMILETRGRMSAAALAEALEVSERTIHRDIDELTSAGVPIYAELGRNGGFALLAGWRTTLTGLTPAEAQAVFLSGLTGPAADLGLSTEVENAQLKVLAALPSTWREDATRVSSRLLLDPIDWYREAPPLTHLPTVSSAVWSASQLAIRYQSWKRNVEREVHPLGLVIKAGTWYLVANVEKVPRTYKVANILEARLLDAPAKRPKNFNLREYWQRAVKEFEQRLYPSEARVRATALGLEYLRELSASIARAVAAATRSAQEDWTTLSIPLEESHYMTRQLTALAPEVEVLSPAALRRKIIQRLELGLSAYKA